MNNRMQNGRVLLVNSLSILLLAAAGVVADDYEWDPGSTSWNNSFSWHNLDNIFEPGINDGTIPDGTDDTATIVAAPAPQLVSNHLLGDLTLSGSGDLFVNTFSLILNAGFGTTGSTLVTGAGSTLYVEQGFVDMDNLTLASGGSMILSGGTAQVDNSGSFGVGTFVTGSGIVEKGGSSTLFNGGVISAANGTLTIRRAGGTSNFNWDGGGSFSELQVFPGATMSIQIPNAGNDYSSLIDLNGGTFNVTNNWGMDSGGVMEMDGSNNVTGAPWGISSGATISVNTGTNTINSSGFNAFPGGSMIVDPGATLNVNSFSKVFYTNAIYTVNGTLRLNNNSTVNSATFGGTGVLNFNSGTATINGTTTINTTTTNILGFGTVDVGAGDTLNVNGDINVTGGTLDVVATGTLNLASGRTLTATANGQVVIDKTYHAEGETIIFNTGADLTTDSLNVRHSSTLTVDGVGSTLTVMGQLQNAVGFDSGATTIRNGATANISGELHLARSFALPSTVGTVNILSDADMTVGGFIRIGDNSEGGTATINVDGSGSTLIQNSANLVAVIGNDTGVATATINITNFGRYSSSKLVVDATGAVNVSTNGVLDVADDLDIFSGGVVDVVTTGDFNWSGFKTMRVLGGGRFTHEDPYFTPANAIINVKTGSLFDVVQPASHDSLLSVDGGTQLLVESGSKVTTDYFHVSDGVATFAGIGTSLDATTGIAANSRHRIGQTTDTATLRFSNGANGSMASATPTLLEVGGQFASTGLLEVLSDADLTLQSLEINNGIVGTSGIVTVDGSGSTVNQVDGSTLDIGAFTGGIARLNATNSGRFNTGVGTTSLGATGEINVSSDGVLHIGDGATAGVGARVDVTANGVLKGNGAINGFLINSGGKVAPGLSVGTLTVNGQFTNHNAVTAILEIEIDGTGVAGTNYDLIIVANDADLTGQLDLLLAGSYTPTLGDEFDFMTVGGAIPDTFDTITNVVQTNPLGLAVRYGLDANQVDMRVSIRGDTDFDDDVDTVDLTAAIIGFTGGSGSDSSWVKGDFDGDGDTDTVDLTTAITNFTGSNAGNANVPDLVYDPATGNVTIDADGADVISFSLQGGPFASADFGDLPAGLTDNIATQIGWTSFNLFSGLTGTADLGAILPAGLNQAGLEAALTTASYGLALSGGGGGGRLDIIIPEPASLILMGLCAVVLVRRKQAA